MSLRSNPSNKNFITAILLLACVAFVFKAVIPAGFMPGSSDGTIAMVICSGMGEKTVYMPASQVPDGPDNQDSVAKDHCAYQLSASQKNILTPPVFIDAPTQIYTNLGYIWQDQAALFTHRALSYTPRGPPLV